MNHTGNSADQPVGDALPDWEPARRPRRSSVEGRLCRFEPLDTVRHLDDLYDAFGDDRDGRLWTYMPVGPFPSKQAFCDWLDSACGTDDPLFHAIVDRSTGLASGVAALMRVKPEIGVIEVGHITYSPRMQRSAMATEAMLLLMMLVFDELGYRRYEWKCDSLNAPSRKAAERLGFRFEGIFEQATIYKRRNRDTAWYAILDRDWPALKRAYRRWLDDSNFGAEGMQKTRLQAFIQSERA
jgi:RimJ/RimL family protein N-acetyltransferase